MDTNWIHTQALFVPDDLLSDLPNIQSYLEDLSFRVDRIEHYVRTDDGRVNIVFCSGLTAIIDMSYEELQDKIVKISRRQPHEMDNYN